MNFFEAELAKINRRIKVIEENPDPSKMQSNKLLFELERELRMEQLEAWKSGKGFGFAHGGRTAFLRALGFVPINYNGEADRIADASPYYEVVRGIGLPDSICDRTVVCIAMVVKQVLPPPSFMITTNNACDPIMLSANMIGRWFHAPIFCIDVPVETNEQALKYIANQLGQCIEYAEATVPGLKFNWERFEELQQIDGAGWNYYHDMYALRKRVPCPISGRDAFRLPRRLSMYPNPKKALEYARIFRDEMYERAEKGRGTVKEEKLRVMWAVTGPYYSDPFALMAKRGVSMPWFQFGMARRDYKVACGGNYGDEKEFGRKLSPLEEEARAHMFNSWASVGSRWVDDTIYVCRDLKIDALINYQQRGCAATLNLSKLLSDAAERELGISTLHIEGSNLDTKYNRTEFEDRINSFIDICFARKGLSQN